MGIVARQSIKAAISNYFGIFLGFLNLFILFPTFFKPADLGAYRLLLETGAILSSFALIGTNYSINRYFPYFRSNDGRHNGFFFWAFSIPIIGYLIVLFALITFKDPILAQFGRDASVLRALYPVLILLVLFSLFQVVLETCSANHGRIAVSNFLREVVLRLLHLLFGYLYYKRLVDFNTCIWLIVLSYAIIVLFNFVYLSKLTNIHFFPDFKFIRKNSALRKDMLRFTLFLFLGGITSLVVSKIDFILISVKRDLSDTAIYSIGFYLATMIEIPKRTILQIATPIISDHMSNKSFEKVSQMFKAITINQLLAGSLLFYVIWLNIDNLFMIMPMGMGDFYKTGKTVVFFIGLAKLIDLLGSASSPIMSNSTFYHFSLVTFLIAVVVAIAANLILIPLLGINGAALATVITAFITQGLTVSITFAKLRIHPFSQKILTLFAILGLFLIPTYLGKWIENPFLDGFVRTLVLGLPMVVVIYRLHISEEFNQTVKKLMLKVGIRLPF